MGQCHVRDYLKLSDRVQVVALSDPVPERRGGALGTAEVNLGAADDPINLSDVRSYANYHDLCTADDVEAVCIACRRTCMPMRPCWRWSTARTFSARSRWR